jgi:hypothetical protein
VANGIEIMEIRVNELRRVSLRRELGYLFILFKLDLKRDDLSLEVIKITWEWVEDTLKGFDDFLYLSAKSLLLSCVEGDEEGIEFDGFLLSIPPILLIMILNVLNSIIVHVEGVSCYSEQQLSHLIHIRSWYGTYHVLDASIPNG